jgi:hypothetical protein
MTKRWHVFVKGLFGWVAVGDFFFRVDAQKLYRELLRAGEQAKIECSHEEGHA